MAKAATKTASTKPMAKDTSKAVAFINPNALSTDVGRIAMENFGEAKIADDQIRELTSENTRRKGQTLMSLTQSFVKAAMADKSVILGDINSDKKDDVTRLRSKLEVAVGIKIATKGEDGTDKLSLADWTKEFLPQPGMDKESEEWRKKETFRTNFAAVFKKAIMAAHAIVLKGMTMKEDKERGVLLLSGKAVKERFNYDGPVALDEKKEFKEGDRKISLAKVPSFTELARISAEAAGTTLTTRVDSRAKLGGAKVSEKDVLEAVKALQNAVLRLKGFGDDLADALEGLRDTIDKALDENEGAGDGEGE